MKKLKNSSNFKSFALRILIPTLLTILLFILTIFIVIIPRVQDNIMDGKREMIKELTNSAWSILTKYEYDERNGLLTTEEAQKTAVSRIQYLRYGEENKDYFWITDMTPIMIMHPFRSDLNGKNLSTFSDPHGKKLFVEFVNTVKKSKHGYVDYMWQWKDDSSKIVPKLSYVKEFEPWHWIIGTGIYLEDVKKEITALSKKMLWISIGISIIIASLLLYIFSQSLRVERKRIDAENELHVSKERYRTLVEAATEGLIMLLDGKISFSNNIISEMTGYENEELVNHSFTDIISKNNNKAILDAFSGSIIKEGQYEINLSRKNGGLIEVLITSSTTVFFGKTVNIITVKDITVDSKISLSSIDYQKLITSLNVGFFRANLDGKGKFVFANETTLQILGYSNIKELSDLQIVKMLANYDDRKNLRRTLIANGFIKNNIIKIQKKNREYAIVSLSLVLSNSKDSDEIVCDGIIEDITQDELKKFETNQLIADLKSNSFIIEQPLKEYVTAKHSLHLDATINDVIKLLQSRKSDIVLLSNANADCIGVITSDDIQKRVLALNLDLDNPAYLIMSSPVIAINESDAVFSAITLCEEKKINHLIVKNESNDIVGVLKVKDVYEALKNSLSFLFNKINNAESDDDLKKCYRQLQIFIKPLINSEMSVVHVFKLTSSFSDLVVKKVIELTLAEIGPSPVDFSFICLGSEGRKEETLYTDQDNAIIYEDVPKEIEVEVSLYFNKLAEKVCNSLNLIGYEFCKGNIMAKNPNWCKPVSRWEKYFANWINTPEPQNLLDAMIFFDLRNVFGDEGITDRLKTIINVLIKERATFLYHLAYNTYTIKPQLLSSGNLISDKNSDIIDLKTAVNLIVMFARTYALQNGLLATNTIDRLMALKAKQVISEPTADEIIFVYNTLMKLRFRNQISQLNSNQPLSNQMNVKKLIDVELSILKKVLSLIPAYQNIISADFRLSN